MIDTIVSVFLIVLFTPVIIVIWWKLLKDILDK